MRIDSSPSFEVSINRFTRESMSGKNEAPLLENVDQIDDGGSDPLAILVIRCRRGHNYSTAYQDRKYLEMHEIIKGFEFHTAAYAKILEAEAEAMQQEQERREAQAKVDMERQQKRNLLRRYKAIQIEFDRLARIENDIYDPDQDTSKLDQLDIKELEGLVGDYGD